MAGAASAVFGSTLVSTLSLVVVRRSSAGAGAEALMAHALESGERALSGNGAAAASGTP
jgi:hypothetical protein